MHSHRSSLASLLSVAGLLVVVSTAGCGGNATQPEATSESASALSTCTPSTSCAGIIGAPPDLTVTCPDYMLFYSVSPAGTPTPLGQGAALQYTVRESDYAGQLAACTTDDTRQCQYFSTYAPLSSWCPGSGSSSGGVGGSSGGKGGCKGTCQ